MKSFEKITILLGIIVASASCKVIKVSHEFDKGKTREQLLMALKWQEAHPIFAKSPTDWTNGAYYLGVVKSHQATNDKSYLETLKTMANRNRWQPWERFFHADDLSICYSYLYLHSLGVENVDMKPTANFIQDHLFKPHPWKDGVAGKKLENNEPDEKNILWWWCDALFMAPPVINFYSKITNNQSLLKEMDKYYRQSYELLYDKEQHLFSRDIRFLWRGVPTDIKEANGQKIFWSRGNGWVFAGLALILSDMPKDYPNRFFYEQLYMDMASRIKQLQPDDGLWRTSLLSPESFDHGEVSGSGFHTFALAWGINNGLLNKSIYKPVVLKAWKAIAACQKEDGKVGWVQNIGANPMPANAESWQNFGTGAFLMAGSEMLKLK